MLLMKAAQVILTTDGAVLCCYGAVSLLLVPGAAGDSYLSWGRLLYGALPVLLGVASLICAIRLGRARRTAN